MAYNLEYTEQEKKFLQDRNVKLSLGYSRLCQCCVLAYPKGVGIPTLMRIHIYATCYGNFYQARDALDSFSSGKGLKKCGSCNSCSAHCVNRIDIGRRINELKVIYT